MNLANHLIFQSVLEEITDSGFCKGESHEKEIGFDVFWNSCLIG